MDANPGTQTSVIPAGFEKPDLAEAHHVIRKPGVESVAPRGIRDTQIGEILCVFHILNLWFPGTAGGDQGLDWVGEE